MSLFYTLIDINNLVIIFLLIKNFLSFIQTVTTITAILPLMFDPHHYNAVINHSTDLRTSSLKYSISTLTNQWFRTFSNEIFNHSTNGTNDWGDSSLEHSTFLWVVHKVDDRTPVRFTMALGFFFYYAYWKGIWKCNV